MISTNTLRGALFVSAAAIAIILPTGSAYATNGYFSSGYGTASKGMAGSGQTAKGLDTQAAATNPAAMRDVGTKWDLSLALFSPIRSIVEDTDSGAINGGVGTERESEDNIFAIPGFGYNRNLDSQSSIGLSVYANGGMNTAYSHPLFSASAPTINTGIDLAQVFMGLTYARDINSKLSIGVTPKLAMQRFKADGLGDFASFSNDSTKLSNNGDDYAFGYGLGFGATYDVNDQFSVGAAYHSRVYMTEFDKYAGLFAEQGDFDVPSSWNLGVSYKVNDKTSVTADYQRINYGEVAAVANSIDTLAAGNLGDNDGAGFGWRDMSTIKLGVSHIYSPTLTLRAGISHNDKNPYADGEFGFNMLAPGVIRTHVSLGATYQNEDNSAWNFALTHGLEESPSGTTGTPAQAGNGLNGEATHTMYQWDLEVAYTYNF